MTQEYAPAPLNYETPEVENARATRAGNSGAVQVGGYFFNWATPEGGFTNNGWFTSYQYGPTGYYGFKSDQDVTAYLRDLETQGQAMNLNAVFERWHDWYVTAGEAGVNAYEEFANAVPYPCKTVQ